MNRKTLIWIGLGVLAVAGLILLSKKSSKAIPTTNNFSGVINADKATIYRNADGGEYVPLKATLNRGQKVIIFKQADGFYKVDCDGLWVNQEDISIDREYRNFVGSLEPMPDELTGKLI